MHTIFAVGDKYFTGSFSRLLRRGLTPEQVQKAQLSAGQQETNLSRLRSIPGATISTNDAAANLRGSTQVIVSDYRRLNAQSSISRRQDRVHDRVRRDSNDSVSTNTTTTNALVTLYSGFGDSVKLYNPDIKYAGGVIQVLDGFFTVPETLSTTNAVLGYTNFANLVDEAKLTSELDSLAAVTVFVPNNAAVQSALLSSESDFLSIVEDHVVVAAADNETVGYLPNLADGQVLTTKNGRQLTISVDGNNNYFVNGVRVTQANIVLSNGVAHIIDDLVVASAKGSAAGLSLRAVAGGSSRLAVAVSAATVLLGLLV